MSLEPLALCDNWLKKRKWKSGTCKSNSIVSQHHSVSYWIPFWCAVSIDLIASPVYSIMISNLDIEKYHEINMDQVFVALAVGIYELTSVLARAIATVMMSPLWKRETNADANATVMNLVLNPGTRITNSGIIYEGKDPTAQNKLYAVRRRGTLIVSISSSVNRYVVNSIEDTRDNANP